MTRGLRGGDGPGETFRLHTISSLIKFDSAISRPPSQDSIQPISTIFRHSPGNIPTLTRSLEELFDQAGAPRAGTFSRN